MKNTRILSVVGMLACLIFAWTNSAIAKDNIDRLIVFGDSLSDPGNAYILLGEQSLPPYDLIPDAPYAIGGHHFSNGSTWAEQFARKVQAQAKPVYRSENNTNFAVGGARARPHAGVDLTMQVGMYLSQSATTSTDDDVFVIFIGGNDIRDAIELLATDPSGASSALLLQAALMSIQDNIDALVGSGAHRFVIANAPDLSLVPALQGQPDVVKFAASQLTINFNQGLDLIIAGISNIPLVEVKKFDVFTLINDVVSNPSSYDLDVVDSACIVTGVIVKSACNNKNEHLFWDGIHPTRAGHKIIANSAFSLFNGN